MRNSSYNNFFANFANKAKLDIILALRKKPLSVGEISKAVKGEQSAVSHNLKHLSECRIVEARQKGKHRIYSLSKSTVTPILKIVERHVREKCGFGCGFKEKCPKPKARKASLERHV